MEFLVARGENYQPRIVDGWMVNSSHRVAQGVEKAYCGLPDSLLIVSHTTIVLATLTHCQNSDSFYAYKALCPYQDNWGIVNCLPLSILLYICPPG